MLSTVTEKMSASYSTTVYSDMILKYANLMVTPVEIYDIEPHVGTRYIGDLYGLFNYLGIDRTKWLILLRMNNLASPTAYDGGSLTLVDYDIEDAYSAIRLELALPD